MTSGPSLSTQASDLNSISTEVGLVSTSSPQKRNSRVMNAVAIFDSKGKCNKEQSKLVGKEFEATFEAVLVSILTAMIRLVLTGRNRYREIFPNTNAKT